MFIQQISKLFSIEEAILLSEQDKLMVESQKTPQRLHKFLPSSRQHKLQFSAKSGIPIPFDWSASIELYERESLRILLNYGSIPLADGKPLCQYLLEEMADIAFQTPLYQQILSLYTHQLAMQGIVEDTFFLQHADEAIQKGAITLVASPYAVSDQWEARYQIPIAQEQDKLHEAAYKTILRLKLRRIYQLIEENNQALKNSPSPEAENQLLQLYDTLKQAEMAITQQLGIVITR